MIKKILLSIIIYVLFTSATFARLKQPVRYIVNIKGECTKAIYFNKNELSQCKGAVINTIFTDGKTGFTYVLNSSFSIAFIGNKDSQANKNEYHLVVNNVVITNLKTGKNLKNNTKNRPKGQCIRQFI